MAIYSLIETTKLHGLNPPANLRQVLERVADLLPWTPPASTLTSINASSPKRPRDLKGHSHYRVVGTV